VSTEEKSFINKDLEKRGKASVASPFAAYWNFIEKFKSHHAVSQGDARAYISALTDVKLVEMGVNDIQGVMQALNTVLESVKNHTITYEDCTSVFDVWRSLDRSHLKKVLVTMPMHCISPHPNKSKDFSAVSLFSGSFGLDLGFESAGFEIKTALDNDLASELIIKKNRENIQFIREDVAKVATSAILKEAGLGVGELDVLTGGPPCQPFSPGGKRLALADPRASPLKEYIRVIHEAQPKVFVMEEVPGLLNARLKHVKFNERHKVLSPEEELGSVWKIVLAELEKTNYRIKWAVLNAANFGAPQLRSRVIIMGVRPDLGVLPILPLETHRKPNLSTLAPLEEWVCLLKALAGISPGNGEPLPLKYKEYMQYVPPGGNWRQIPKERLAGAMNGALAAEGGKMGFYRRLTLLEPSPTLVTSPCMKGSMLIHPIEDRPLTINEYKRIQGFPQDWETPVSLMAQYRKIGEAVPPFLSYPIAMAVRKLLEKV